MNWQRARSDDQVEQRVDTIIDAAANLYSQYRFDEITFAMIGKQAQFTRSNLYRYFKTKEEVFLQLLIHDIVSWRNDVQQTFSSPASEPTDFVEQWLDLGLRQERMLRLFSITFTVIEHNVSDEALLAFKRELFNEIDLVCTLLTELNYFNSAEKASNFLIAQMSLISGMYPMIQMPDRQKKIMTELGLLQSAEQYRMTLNTAIRGLYQGFSLIE